jgi:hypothetical protein
MGTAEIVAEIAPVTICGRVLECTQATQHGTNDQTAAKSGEQI